MSALKQLYTTLLQRIKDEVPEIKFVEQFNNQLEEEENELPFPKPAVLIEIEEPEWVSLSRQRQSAQVTFNLFVITEIVQETSTLQSDMIREKGLANFDIIEKLKEKMHNWHIGGFAGTVRRTSARLDTYHGLLRADFMPFSVRVYEDQQETMRLDPDPTLEIET